MATIPKKNPFEGLFEAETQPVKTVIPAKSTPAPKTQPQYEPEKKESIWTSIAKAVLPKKIEEYFGLISTPDYWEKAAKAELPKQAGKLFGVPQEVEPTDTEKLSKLQQEIKAGGGKLPIQTALEVLKETPKEKYLPYIGDIPEITNALQLYQSAKRVQNDEETITDIYRLAKYKAESERDKTFAAKVMSVLVELPAFGLELLTTAGIYAVGKEATEKVIKETLEEAVEKGIGRIAKKTAGTIVGGTLQTIPARIGDITAGTIQNMIPDYKFETNEFDKLQPVITGEGEDLWKAAAKSLSDQWVEVVSEHSGGIFNEALTPIKNQLVKTGILKSFLKTNPTARVSDFMKWVNRAGWNGILAEMGEERVGELMRGVLSELGLSDEGWKIPTKEQLAVELVSFSVPGVMIGATNKALSKVESSFLPPKKETPMPKTVSQINDIVGARDILSISRGATEVDAGAMEQLRSDFNDYTEKMSTPVIDFVDEDYESFSNIKVVPYPDGKWGYSYEVNTPEVNVAADFLTNKITNTREEAVKNAKTELISYLQKEVEKNSDLVTKDVNDIIKHVERIQPGSDVPFEIRKEQKAVESDLVKKVKSNIAFYQKLSISHAGDIQPVSPALRDLEVQAKEPEIIKYVRGRVQEAIKNKEIALNEDGTITLWRAGQPVKENRLVSATYTKEAAEEFAEGMKALRVREKGLELPITSFNVSPEDIKIFIGGVEKEVLVMSDAMKETTQKEKVKEAVKEKPKTIKEVAEETKILEPNVRRIFGVGAKDGTFERVDKGVYVLRKDGKELAYIETGDAIEVLPRMAKEGFKADMVFLDIPYKTPAVVGGNRGIKYEYITPEQFATVMSAVKDIARDEDTPVFYMFSQAKSGEKEMARYTDKLSEAGFKPIARGDYTKLQNDGITRVRNMRGNIIEPEGILLLTQSGNTDMKNPDLNFKLVRPRGYQTEKPAEMIKAMIEMSTDEGDVVLDPFAGSGVVPAEAVKAGRKAVAVEISEKAVEEHIKPRVEEAAKEIKTIPKELEPLAKEAITFESARLWKLSYEGISTDKSNAIAKKLIDAGFIEKPPVGIISKKIIPDFDNFYEVAKKIYEKKPRFAKKAPAETKPVDIAKKPIEVVKRIAVKNQSLPILSEFRVEKGKLYATDLEISLRLNTDLKDGMYKVVGKEAVKTDTDPVDFPLIPEVKAKLVFKALNDYLLPAVKRASTMISKDNMRRDQLTGVAIKVLGNKITIASTDSHRLYQKTILGKVSGEGKFMVSVPQKLAKVLGDIGGLVEFRGDPKEDLLNFSGNIGDITVRKVDGEFPAYEYIYPAFTKQYSFDRKAMLIALKEIKPFADKFLKDVKIEYADNQITLSAENKTENISKTITVPTSFKEVDIKAQSPNDGVIVMPIKEDEGATEKMRFNVSYLIDAFNALESDDVYFYAPKEMEQPFLFSEESELVSKDRGNDHNIDTDTKLFHGTTTKKATSIISDGIKRTEDETATYGKAVYLTPDYQTAQDYADETGKGQVVAFKSLRDLKLYEPTIKERETLVDLVGEKQDEAIKEMLKPDYDGLYIPDDGRGDGGEQVIIYDFNDYIFDKPELANEPRTGKTKIAPSGMAAAGGDKLGNFEEIAGLPKKTPSQLKIYEKVKGLIQKYAKTIGEGYLPRNALGVYYPDTTNIRIKGMNALSIATHEITHFLDKAYNISKELMGVKGYSITGKPIYKSETYKIRQEMTALYEKYYPGAKRTHKLEKRMLEGFATLLEKYTEQPSTISATYSNLVREFLTSEGKYYKPVMTDIINDLREIITEYQGLEALDKIGARVVNDKVNVNKDSFLNFAQRVKTEIADNIYPIEVLAKQAGVHFTKADPSLWARQYNSSNALILNNINGNRGYWGWRNGEMTKLHDFNFKDLITKVKKANLTDEFANYLVSRREYFLYQELAETKDEARKAEIQKILDNDGFTEKEVNDAYLENKDKFSEFEKMYDALVREDLEFLHDPQVQLIDSEQYDNLTSQEGYASFKRDFYDEIAGEKEVSLKRVRFGTAKVSSLIKRAGSQKPIINPLFSALTNHAEITRKGLKQIVYNRIGDIAKDFPDLFQRLQLKGIPDRQGRILFPQEKDPSIIMARANYKRVPILTDSTIKRTVDEVLNFQNIHTFEKLLMGASRFFTKGTTGLFPGFAITNYAVDQASATAQTRNKYIPLYDPLTKLVKILDNNNPHHIYLQEYLVMGGERQTFVGWQDLSPNELFDVISNEKAGLLKLIDYLNSGMDLLATPSKWSEIATRATEYIKARQAGKTPIVALEEAGRVTAPFHHVGRWGGGRVGQTYIKSIPFFNPAIEVLAQSLETLETAEGRQRYAFVALAITAASIASLGLIMTAGSDDQKKLYVDIHPDELNKYIWLPSPDKKTLIKIRVPDQMAFIATLINMLWADKALQGNYTAGEYLTAGVSWLPQQFDPSDLPRALMAWIPQIIKPGVLALANVKDFPKIMPLESRTQISKPPGLRFTEATSPVAKWLGKEFGLSPIKIDYLLEGYVGRVARFFTGKPGAYDPFKAMSREYYFTSGRKIQQYYERKEKNDQDYYAYKHKLRDFKVGERSAILKERARLKRIDDVIDAYKDIDSDKSPKKATKLRDQILKLIDEL